MVRLANGALSANPPHYCLPKPAKGKFDHHCVLLRPTSASILLLTSDGQILPGLIYKKMGDCCYKFREHRSEFHKSLGGVNLIVNREVNESKIINTYLSIP